MYFIEIFGSDRGNVFEGEFVRSWIKEKGKNNYFSKNAVAEISSKSFKEISENPEKAKSYLEMMNY